MIYGGFHNLPNGVRFLSESLLRFNTLREFECKANKLLDNDTAMLIESLAGHNNMTKIDLYSNRLGGGRALAELAAC